MPTLNVHSTLQVKHHPARDMDQEKGSLWKMNACLTHFQNRAMQVNLTVFLEGKRPVSKGSA